MDRKFPWEPSQEIIEISNIYSFNKLHDIGSYNDLVERANDDPEWFWDAIYKFFKIEFEQPYTSILDLSRGIEWPHWCRDGKTNIVAHCLDRYRGTSTWDKVAVIGESENGVATALTYAELDGQVTALAALLKRNGIGRGDVVAIYLPMIPAASVAFFAVLKIGAIVLPLFSGYGPQPVRQRVQGAQVRAVITTGFAWRRGAPVEMLQTVDRAVEALDPVPKIIVLERDGTGASSADHVVWRMDGAGPEDCATEIVDAEAPAMLMYTSGTTGAPKGTIHTHCGMLAKNALDMGLCVDLQAGDRLLWMSDMGWIAGPKMILSALLLGATLVMAEGTPTWPRTGRLFEMIAKHRITMLGIVPTIVRQMMRTDPAAGRDHDLSSLRITVSAGEPWTEDAWWWFFTEVCRSAVPIINYAGGTEVGGAILVGTPLQPIRPGSFGGPVPGSGADVVDPAGRSVAPGTIGELVMRRPSIGVTRGLWKDDGRYIDSYWTRIPGLWLQGDLASRDDDGLWYLHGRSDDVIKVAGKRTGPSEIEAVVIGTGLARDCFVVGVPDAITGSALACAYVPADQGEPADVTDRISKAIIDQCGAAYRPRHFLRVEELPRTRNEKRMRHVVRAIILGAPVGDVSACTNPQVIDQISRARTEQLPAI